MSLGGFSVPMDATSTAALSAVVCLENPIEA
jgi:hypothetical protein